MFDIQSIRQDFPTIQPDSIYLDSAASSLTPFPVLEAMSEYYMHHRTNLHRGMHRLAMKTARKFDGAMENIAKFIGAQVEEISITTNATYAINQVALSLDFAEGDEVIVSTLEHSSNVLPWLRLAKKCGILVRWWEAEADGSLDLEKLVALFSPRTRLLALTHVSNALGVITPVEEVGRLCNERGILYLIDACQSIPHLPLDVKRIGCHFMAFSGHKMCGPTGIGVLYLKASLAQQMDPALTGGGAINTYRTRYDGLANCTVDSFPYSDLPHKWIAGTPPIAETLGLSAAIDYLTAVSMDALVQHDRQLLEQTLTGLREIPGVVLFGPSDLAQRSAIVSFNISGLHPLKVGRLLTEEFDIGLRAGHHCALTYFHEVQPGTNVEGNVRASFYLYTTADEIERFLAAVKTVAATRIKQEMIG